MIALQAMSPLKTPPIEPGTSNDGPLKTIKSTKPPAKKVQKEF